MSNASGIWSGIPHEVGLFARQIHCTACFSKEIGDLIRVRDVASTRGVSMSGYCCFRLHVRWNSVEERDLSGFWKGRRFMDEIMEKIKGFFLSNNITVYGIAQSSSLENEPSGCRPSDVLPGARSVLCMGMPFPKGIFRSPGRAEQMYWRSAAVYYRHIDAILMQAANVIEENGETAVPVYG